mgnify:FL=1
MSKKAAVRRAVQPALSLQLVHNEGAPLREGRPLGLRRWGVGMLERGFEGQFEGSVGSGGLSGQRGFVDRLIEIDLISP